MRAAARRTKRVPENIHYLLTARALAYWLMDDGHSDQNGRRRAYRFSTHSFPLKDQEILVQALKDNFDIYSKALFLDATYRLYIRSKSAQLFINLVHPYIHPCFAYKI